jgi:hypothetical protein
MKVTIGNSSYEAKVSLLPWQKRNLSYTRTGYGSKIPSPYKVFYKGVWRRIYCTVYGNSGTSWIVCGRQRVVVQG